jgi:hypothetical protein
MPGHHERHPHPYAAIRKFGFKLGRLEAGDPDGPSDQVFGQAADRGRPWAHGDGPRGVRPAGLQAATPEPGGASVPSAPYAQAP